MQDIISCHVNYKYFVGISVTAWREPWDVFEIIVNHTTQSDVRNHFSCIKMFLFYYFNVVYLGLNSLYVYTVAVRVMDRVCIFFFASTYSIRENLLFIYAYYCLQTFVISFRVLLYLGECSYHISAEVLFIVQIFRIPWAVRVWFYWSRLFLIFLFF